MARTEIAFVFGWAARISYVCIQMLMNTRLMEEQIGE